MLNLTLAFQTILSAVRPLAVISLCVISISGCASAIKPDDLALPLQITCVNLKQPLVASGTYGLGYTWITRIERGPYWSEREDEKGTYYRGPPGGLSIKGPEGNALGGWPATMDGGFYIPNDPNESPKTYWYFSTTDALIQVPPEESDCYTAGYVRDPSTSRISVWSFAASGAVGGAAGGLIGRSMSRSSNMSYGQAASTGAAGGLIAGVIIATIINADVGKIISGLPIQDKLFLEQLRKLHANRVPAKELPSSAIVGGTTKQ